MQINQNTRGTMEENLSKLKDREILLLCLWFGFYTGVTLTRDEAIQAVGLKRSARTYIFDTVMRKLF